MIFGLGISWGDSAKVRKLYKRIKKSKKTKTSELISDWNIVVIKIF